MFVTLLHANLLRALRYHVIYIYKRANTTCSLVTVACKNSGSSGSGIDSFLLARSIKSPLFTMRYGGGPVFQYSQTKWAAASGSIIPVGQNLHIQVVLRYACI